MHAAATGPAATALPAAVAVVKLSGSCTDLARAMRLYTRYLGSSHMASSPATKQSSSSNSSRTYQGHHATMGLSNVSLQPGKLTWQVVLQPTKQ